jgi:hypothetical protein
MWTETAKDKKWIYKEKLLIQLSDFSLIIVIIVVVVVVVVIIITFTIIIPLLLLLRFDIYVPFFFVPVMLL